METWRLFFFPVAWLYGLAVRFRHWLFDVGFLKSEKMDVPVIGVGNLSMGGTGKTPMVEFLIRTLSDNHKLAVLSRGYGRKTRGFTYADQYSSHEDIGDEPMQYARKFGGKVKVAVDEKRVEGVRSLMTDDPQLEVVVLDDCFQHRYIQPGLNILLTDINKVYKEDYLFPVGNLRDVIAQAKRADIIVVTKTNKVLSPITKRRIKSLLKPAPHQSLYFSYLTYGQPVEVESMEVVSGDVLKARSIVMFSGVANSYPFQEYLREFCTELTVLDFPDHHNYSFKDLQKIRKVFDDTFSSTKILVTTEKDAMRLMKTKYLSALKGLPLYFVPIETKLHGLDETNFVNQINKYVKENSRSR